MKFTSSDYRVFSQLADAPAAQAQSAIDMLEENFDLVMISELMDESLILMRHALCWDLENIVAFRYATMIHWMETDIFFLFKFFFLFKTRPHCLVVNFLIGFSTSHNERNSTVHSKTLDSNLISKIADVNDIDVRWVISTRLIRS